MYKCQALLRCPNELFVKIPHLYNTKLLQGYLANNTLTGCQMPKYASTCVSIVAENPSATGAASAGANVTVAVVTDQDIKNAKKAAKTAQKLADFNKKFRGQSETIV